MFFLSCVCYAFGHVYLYVPCGHLLGKGWPLGSRLWCQTVSLFLSNLYPGSGVVLDCIDSWPLHPYDFERTCNFALCCLMLMKCKPYIRTFDELNELYKVRDGHFTIVSRTSTMRGQNTSKKLISIERYWHIPEGLALCACSSSLIICVTFSKASC